MGDRPILFQGDMIRALLAGTKTQTRRALKIQPLDILPMQGEAAGREWVTLVTRDPESKGRVVRCRYGAPGDRLWVRETWQAVNGNDRARHIVTHPAPDRGWIEYAATPRADEPAYKWRPSIHMPRWASRITLEITGVRVEKLGDLSESDARQEGVASRDEFIELWKSINGQWEPETWTWVLQFRKA